MSNELPLSFAIRKASGGGRVAVMADIKPVSPKDGELLGQRKPAELARSLVNAGACALSVVTEAKNFGGSIEVLKEVARAVSLPVLRKDFISDPVHIDESYQAGASAVLLIMATIPHHLAPLLYQRTGELGMEAVVEIHSEQELGRALELNPTIIGINNRDILELETDSGDVRVTETLAPLVPDSILVLSESALQSREDVQRAVQAGADAVLVGTAILQSSDPSSFLKGLTQV
jgi:indole-3-glycerol phosphate synthase